MPQKIRNKKGEVNLWKILEREKNNQNEVCFYLKKYLWKTYDKSLFHFSSNLNPNISVFKTKIEKEKKITGKTTKEISQIFFGGVSVFEMDELLMLAKEKGLNIETSHWGIRIYPFFSVGADFEKWKMASGRDAQKNADFMDVIRKIQKFSLENNTPMRCFEFLMGLKLAIKEIDL
jgi:hypothetical protein